MTLSYDPPMMLQSISDYMAANGIAHRKTVARLLEQDRLPGARQDERGVWWIPAGAVPEPPRPKAAVATITPRPIEPGVLEPFAYTGELEVTRTRDEQLDDAPTWMRPDAAARLYGLPRTSLLEDPARFGGERRGPRGRDGQRAWRFPLAGLRKDRGR